MAIVELIAGLGIVLFTLWDAFETIVLPRTVQRRFRLTRMIARTTWLPWVALTRLPIGENRRDWLLAIFGPLLLLFLLIAWALLLVCGFGVMLHALAWWATPADRDLGSLFYLSGSTFFTLGLGDVVPFDSAARFLSVVEAGTGFGFLALVIGYLPISYQAFSRREIAISLLDARAGSPPTAVELLRRNRERVATEILAQWEGWAAELLESHLSYPVLAYFRSQHEKQSWLAALVLILDASALLMTAIDGLSSAQARFTFAIARHTLVDLAQVFFVEPRPPEHDRLPHDVFLDLCERLDGQGFRFSRGSNAETTLAGLRVGYEPIANALAQRLLLDLPPWIPSADAEDDWQSSPWDVLPPI
jgi:hypothetical protein